MKKVFALLIVATLGFVVTPAHAHTQELTVVRDVTTRTSDSSVTDGAWTITVTEVTKNVQYAIVGFRCVGCDSTVYASVKGRVGATDSVSLPADAYDIFAVMPPGKADASITIRLEHPL